MNHLKGEATAPNWSVARAALQNAALIADLLLTTKAMISDFPGDDTATAMPGAAGGMDF